MIMKTKAPTNGREILQEYEKLLENVLNLEEGPKKVALIKGIKKDMQDNIEATKLYLELRPRLSIEEKERLDKLTGWFEHQDN